MTAFPHKIRIFFLLVMLFGTLLTSKNYFRQEKRVIFHDHGYDTELLLRDNSLIDRPARSATSLKRTTTISRRKSSASSLPSSSGGSSDGGIGVASSVLADHDRTQWQRQLQVVTIRDSKENHGDQTNITATISADNNSIKDDAKTNPAATGISESQSRIIKEEGGTDDPSRELRLIRNRLNDNDSKNNNNNNNSGPKVDGIGSSSSTTTARHLVRNDLKGTKPKFLLLDNDGQQVLQQRNGIPLFAKKANKDKKTSKKSKKSDKKSKKTSEKSKKSAKKSKKKNHFTQQPSSSAEPSGSPTLSLVPSFVPSAESIMSRRV